MAGEYSELSLVVLEWQVQAFARGFAEGRAQAQAELCPIAHKMLLSLVQAKFQVDPLADLVAAVQSPTDPGVYRQWFNLALHASSLEELRIAFRPS